MIEETDSSNIHQHYVNAERGDEGLPKYFLTKIENNPQNDLLQEAVFRELWYSDDSIHSLRSLDSKFDENRQTIQSRLDEMVEQGILKKGSINNGDYWWINFPASERPLPKDIVVHPKPSETEMTVDQFFKQTHVIVGVVALLATAISGAVVLFGALQLNGGFPLPIPAQDILTAGLFGLYTSYIFLLAGMVLWVLNQAFGSTEARDLF